MKTTPSRQQTKGSKKIMKKNIKANQSVKKNSLIAKNQSQNARNTLSKILNGFNDYSLVADFDKLADCDAIVYYFGAEAFSQKQKNVEAIIETHALDFQLEELKLSDKKNIHFIGRSGPVWIICQQPSSSMQHGGLLDESSYTFAREQFGVVLSQAKSLKLNSFSIYFQQATNEEHSGAIVGLELASYQFLNIFKNEQWLAFKPFNIQLNVQQKTLSEALSKSSAVQLARHLVNLPPNIVNPASVQELVEAIPFSKKMKITTWDEKKCEAEGMNLFLAVGAGASISPRMIRLSYRPSGSKLQKPVAFVGKGVTFDTGGLDIKPSSAMRLMKKDMGGAAAVVALAYWVDAVGYERPCDFYLALAENAVDGFSMRPSDVYKSRAGYLVEIDNTDAEGRLVLADVMDVAITQKGPDEPEYLIDIATLTGAIKVALGSDVAGLFTNDDDLGREMSLAGQRAGDLNWRMPLIQKYFSGMSSQFADFKNSADGFGGAITAALFLQKFAGQKKWAHLDVYSWNDKPTGALTAGSASGQPVQAMIEWLKAIV